MASDQLTSALEAHPHPCCTPKRPIFSSMKIPLNLVPQHALDRALHFLACAFGGLGLALGGHVGAVGGVAGDLFGFSGGLVGGALGLIGHFTHWSAPSDRA